MSARVLTYLACPYSDPDQEVCAARFRFANVAAGTLMNAGHVVFSPISHTHPILRECGLPHGWDYWQAFDRAYLAASKQLVILCLCGWEESVGIKGEMAIAAEMQIPVAFMLNPDSKEDELIWYRYETGNVTPKENR